MEAIKETIDGNIVCEFCRQHQHLRITNSVRQDLASTSGDSRPRYCCDICKSELEEDFRNRIYFCTEVTDDAQHGLALSMYSATLSLPYATNVVAIPYSVCAACEVELYDMVEDNVALSTEALSAMGRLILGLYPGSSCSIAGVPIWSYYRLSIVPRKGVIKNKELHGVFC